MIKNKFFFINKGIIIAILFLLNNKVCSTPTTEDGFFDNEYYAKYVKIGEVIYEVNNIDINNYGLYEGYMFKDEDKCKVQVELKPYNSDIKIFEVDICKETSRILIKVKK